MLWRNDLENASFGLTNDRFAKESQSELFTIVFWVVCAAIGSAFVANSFASSGMTYIIIVGAMVGLAFGIYRSLKLRKRREEQRAIQSRLDADRREEETQRQIAAMRRNKAMEQ